MIDHAVDLVRDAGIPRIVANLHHLPHRVAPHLTARDVITTIESPAILETGGGLLNALPLLASDPVVTLNPDAAWRGPNPVRLLLDAWSDTMTALLLLIPLTAAATTRDTGDFSFEQGRIRRKGHYLYTGAQILRTGRLAEIPGPAFSLNRYWDLLAVDTPLHGLVYPGQWCDIGHPEGLARAERMLADAL